jgi:microsomal dipeptidase-like Zn-dependent dipeptidase
MAPVGLEDATKYPVLTASLLHTGFSAEGIAMIMGMNLLRVFRTSQGRRLIHVNELIRHRG